MSVYFSSDHALVSWDEALAGVVMEWKGEVQGSDEFRTVIQRELELIEQEHPRKLYLDMRKMGFIQPEDQAWLHDYWDPRAVASGLKFVAMVVPERSMPRQLLPILTEAGTEKGLIIQYFWEPESAREWLMGI
jgi:hypothetical protein